MTTVEGEAWIADDFGPATETLALRPRTWEAPPPGALLVEVAAAGVGLPDLFMTKGEYPLVRRPPVTPGQEVCGTVVAKASGSRFAAGDRVLGPTRFHAGAGGFATHTYVSEGNAMLVPAGLSNEEAAGFYVGFRTAYTALVTRCRLTAGETVLVLGGSGSTGATAIVLAKALGARVIAVASSEPRREFCRSIGADIALDRTAEAIEGAVADHTEGRGFDIVIDPVGGDLANATLRTVARYGRFAVIGFASGSWPTIDPIDMVMRNYSVVGVLAAGFTATEDLAHCGELGRLAGEGLIATPLGTVGEMADVPNVIASLESGAEPGKIVVRV